MITEDQETRANLYALGSLTKNERLGFEEEIRFNEELRQYAIELCEVATESALANLDLSIRPPADLKNKILSKIREIPTEILRAFQLKEGEGFVMTDPSGKIQWVNSDFSEMCGYSLDEIKGKKPADFLQGPDSDPAQIDAMRKAIREFRPVHAELVNYHKNGDPYHVSISISPVMDESRKPRCYVAIEREIMDRSMSPAFA